MALAEKFEGKMLAFLLREAAIDVHVEERGSEVGSGIRVIGQGDPRNGDAAGLNEIHGHIGCAGGIVFGLIARNQQRFARIKE
jgi:hypothetical protein